MLLSFLAYSNQGSKKVAIVKIKRGEATIISPDGSTSEINKGMWLKEGAIVKTGDKSFVKLSFIDKSSMNVGPKSELKIEKFSKDDAGVINVLTGKIRSKVTKDYLNMEKDKSKLFVKSKSAVMGIRGTDFLFSTNKKNGATTAVLFEGSVVFNKLNRGDDLRDLESIVNKGRRIEPGQFSVTMKGKTKPTVPSKMSSKQIHGLEKNEDFKTTDVSKSSKSTKKSVVPPGLSGDVVMGSTTNLKSEVEKVIKTQLTGNKLEEASPEEKEKMIEESKGFVAGDDVKPADGTVVDVDTGIMIPLGKDSTFDSNTGEWVSNTVGTIDTATGDYLPPEGYQITDDGKMLKTDEGTGAVQQVVIEVKPVDEALSLDEAQVVEYQAPDPALLEETKISGEDDKNLVDEFEALEQVEVIEEDPMAQTESEGVQPVEGPTPAGTSEATVEEGSLERPPAPSDLSTADQLSQQLTPPSEKTPTTTTQRTRTRLRIKVRKQP